MSTLKIFTDANVARAIVDQLRQRDVDVVRCEDVGMKYEEDTALLEYAVSEDRSVLTFDYDFGVIGAAWTSEGKRHCGIFKCNPQLQGNIGIGRIVSIIAEYHELIRDGAGTLENDIFNRILYINKKS